MSRRRRRDCCCARPVQCCAIRPRVGGIAGIGGTGLGCGGFDPCKLALFLLVLKKACIIDHETATILIFLFMLCCRGFGNQSLCAGC